MPLPASSRSRPLQLHVEELEQRAVPSTTSAPTGWAISATTTNDPYYQGAKLWGMFGDLIGRQNPNGSQANEAWYQNITGSKDLYVVVLDEGIDIDHPDLRDNIWTNPFDPLDGIDNDGNGYVDDLHGWDFFNNDNTVYDGKSWDNVTDAHGTHVAGTIGALGDNGQGVVGVSRDVTIISTKFLGPNGGWLSDAARAINYAVDLKLRHHLNIVAINASWSTDTDQADLREAIQRAAAADILFVAAAGNARRNIDSTPSYPAGYDTGSAVGYDTVLSVAGISSSGWYISVTNYGTKSVDLGAPGMEIYSTLPNNRYGMMTGTSMAAPHVTGAAILYAEAYRNKFDVLPSAATIRQAILDAASKTYTAGMNGKAATKGRLNIGEMLNTLKRQTAPAATDSLRDSGATWLSTHPASTPSTATAIKQSNEDLNQSPPLTSPPLLDLSSAWSLTFSPVLFATWWENHRPFDLTSLPVQRASNEKETEMSAVLTIRWNTPTDLQPSESLLAALLVLHAEGWEPNWA